MRHVDGVSFVVIFLLPSIIRPAHLKDFGDTYTMRNSIHRYRSTIPTPNIFVSYSHTPSDKSYKMIQNENSENDRNQNRPKRGVIELYDMVMCTTNCNPLIYKGYGCYCGFLGSGYPVDPIDRCCKEHDWCYQHANCQQLLVYATPYTWTCVTGRPMCLAGWSCSSKLCDCDRRLATCLKNYACPQRQAVCPSSAWRLFLNLISF